MKRLQLALLLLFVSVCADAQHSEQYWKSFLGTYAMRDLELDGDSLWIVQGFASGGGLTRVLTTTGEIINLNTTSSNIYTNQVQKITIDQNHVKYLGADDGLYKCEGNEISMLYPNLYPSFNAAISDIEVDASNNVWFTRVNNINTFTKEVIKYDGQTFIVYDSLNSNLPNNAIRSLKKDRSGNLYVLADHSILKYDGIDWQIVDSTNTQSRNSFGYFCIDALGHFWLTSILNNRYGVYHFDGSAWTFLDSTNSPIGYSGVFGIAADDSGNVYMPQLNLLKTDGVNWTVYDSTNMLYNHNHVYNIEVDQLGNLWFADEYNKIVKYDFSTYTVFPITNYPDVGDLFFDIEVGKNNEVWFNFSQGYTRYKDSIWTSFWNFNYPVQNLYGMCVDTTNVFWGSLSYTSTTSNLLVHIQDSVVGYAPMQGDYCWGVTCDKMNRKWYVKPNLLVRYNQPGVSNFSTSNSPLISAGIDWLFVDNNNKLWISEDGYTYLQTYDGTNWQTIDLVALGFTTPRCISMAEDNQHNVYLQCYDDNTGLMEIGKYNGIDCTIIDTLTTTSPGKILFDKYDILWRNELGNYIDDCKGISKFIEGSWLNYNVYNSDISGNVIYDFAVDGFNNIWTVGQYSGIGVFNENGLNFTTPVPKRMAVMGKCFFDVDSNGIKAANEPYLLGQNIIETTTYKSTSSNADGSYKFNLMQGNYSIAASPYNGWRVTTDSLSYHINVNDSTQNDSLDFGLTAPLFHRLSVDLNAALPRCGFTVPYWLHYVNTGTAIDSGIVSLTLDTTSVFVSALPSPDSVAGNTLFWHYDSLGPYQQQTIYINVQIYNYGLDSAYQGGAFISDAFSISYNDGVSQNIFASDTLTQEVLCAFDPNEKTVIPTGIGLLHNISGTDTLDYTIHFQNVGNDTAFFVKVIDTLSTWLNPISLQIISASHDYSFTNNNGILTFDFAQCNLPDSSKNYAASCGYVRFKIAQKNANPAATVINNTAHIYFNYNRSISTNTVFNTIATPVNIANENSDENNEVQVFPNPMHDLVTVIYPNAAHQECTIVLKNMLGQPIYKTVSQSEKVILSNLILPTGVYIVEIKCGDKEYNKKLIVN